MDYSASNKECNTNNKKEKEELDELITIAEESAKEIDKLMGDKNKIIQQLLLIYSASFLFITSLLLLISFVDNMYLDKKIINGTTSEILFAMFSIFTITYTVYSTYIKLIQLKFVKKSLLVEKDIHKSLITMLDDKFRQDKYNNKKTSVSLATAEMRIKRLNRTNI